MCHFLYSTMLPQNKKQLFVVKTDINIQYKKIQVYQYNHKNIFQCLYLIYHAPTLSSILSSMAKFSAFLAQL